MADTKVAERPVEVMSAMVNQVLIQIGRFFRDHSSHDHKYPTLARGLIEQVVPTANERFHDALDEIEIEIINAKSVMERDLALIRSKRAERDRAAGFLKAPSPDDDLVTKAEEENEALDMTRTDDGSEIKRNGDVVMVDGHSEPLATELAGTNMSIKAMKLDFDGSDPALQGIAQYAKASITIDTQKSSPNAATKEQEVHDQLMETPTTANLGDAAFESMFNDTDNADGDDLMDYDFSAGTNINQEILNDAAFDSIPINNGALTNLNSTSNEDINSLLPGLENHLDATNNFSTVFSTTVPESDTKPNEAAITAADPQGFESAPTESNFDELFPSSEFADDNEDFNMNNDGNLDELADFDNWWKPEAT